MYLYIGRNEVLPEARVVGIFDLDKCGAGGRTKEYLARAEKEGAVVDVSGKLPRAFVVATHPYHRQIVYLSQHGTAALRERRDGWDKQTPRGGER